MHYDILKIVFLAIWPDKHSVLTTFVTLCVLWRYKRHFLIPLLLQRGRSYSYFHLLLPFITLSFLTFCESRTIYDFLPKVHTRMQVYLGLFSSKIVFSMSFFFLFDGRGGLIQHSTSFFAFLSNWQFDLNIFLSYYIFMYPFVNGWILF